ncbi:MAG: GNAT family N-acetyltransferase [Devosia sp.]
MNIQLVRWPHATLPVELGALLAESEEAGVEWMARFAQQWQDRPFLDAGEGLFLAMLEDVPVAMAVISRDGMADDPDAGRLRYIFVSPAVRRQGIAEALVTAALVASDQRWQRVTLHTDNPNAAALYLRHGFRESHEAARTTHVRLNPRQKKTAP